MLEVGYRIGLFEIVLVLILAFLIIIDISRYSSLLV